MSVIGASIGSASACSDLRTVRARGRATRRPVRLRGRPYVDAPTTSIDARVFAVLGRMACTSRTVDRPCRRPRLALRRRPRTSSRSRSAASSVLGTTLRHAIASHLPRRRRHDRGAGRRGAQQRRRARRRRPARGRQPTRGASLGMGHSIAAGVGARARRRAAGWCCPATCRWCSRRRCSRSRARSTTTRSPTRSTAAGAAIRSASPPSCTPSSSR